MAKNYVALEFDKLKSESHKMKKQVRKGAYDEVLIEAHHKLSLPDDVTISKLTIQSCFKPNHQLLVAHPGPYSPMIKIEPLLLDMLLQLHDMNAPVTCREGLELTRSLVKDFSMMIEEIKSWKDKHLHNDESNDSNDDGTEVIGKA